MISRKYNFVFQHIPKCAGSSIINFFIELHKQSNCLGDLQYEMHQTFKQSKDKYRMYYDKFFKFTFVRNPWSRAVSLFEYRKKLAEQGITYPHWPSIKDILKDDFYDTVQKDFSNTNSSVQFLEEGCSSDYWLSPKIKKNINFVGRFESFEKDFEFILNELSIPYHLELPHENKSSKKHYSEYYNDETRNLVAIKYKRDIELFGYKFED